jgi:dolichyl-phosphate beta-glucosyltransferase
LLFLDRRIRKVKKKKHPELSIIIPLYNEGKRFPKSFKKIEDFFKKTKIDREYILVDDGSTDNTNKIISKLKSKYSIINLTHPKNMGKGAALKLGVSKSNGKNIFFTDADLSTPIEEFEKLYKHLKSHDMVIGSRRLQTSEVRIAQPFHRRFLGGIFYIIFSNFFTKSVKDTNCGFKLYKGDIGRNMYSRIKNDRWGFDAELIFLADKLNFKIKEIPVLWLNDPFSRVSTLSASINTVSELVRIKLNYALGRYNNVEDQVDKTYFSILNKSLQVILQYFFKAFFLLVGNPDKTPDTKKAIKLYEDNGFAGLFTKIRLWDSPMEEIQKLAPKKGLVVDLGCGDGFLANYLAISNPQTKIIGIELNESRIKNADKGLKNTNFIAGSILEKKIPAADAILLIHVMHHLPSHKDQEILLKQCATKLKKGGELIVAEITNKPFLKYIFTYFTDAVLVPILFEKRVLNKDVFYRSTSQWIDLLSSLGFKAKIISTHNRSKPFSHVLISATK